MDDLIVDAPIETTVETPSEPVVETPVEEVPASTE